MKKTIIIAITILLTGFVVAFSPRSHMPALYASATLDFPNTAAGTVNDLTVTVTGAAAGDIPLLSIPDGAITANGGYFAWISSPNTATIRFFNNALLTAYNPTSAVFTLIVWKK